MQIRLADTLNTPAADGLPAMLQAFDTIFDKSCPQNKSMDIVRCNAHQHFGGQCVELINLDRNETICRSCPSFGTQAGVPGDELGYVVNIPVDDLTPPYTIAPGTRVRIQVACLPECLPDTMTSC